MWNNANLLNTIADALFLAATGIAVWLTAEAALRTPLVPLRTIAVVGDLRHVDVASVGSSLQGRVAGNFFGVSLGEARRSLERLPWVRRAELRREWPDRLVARIEEHVALARWTDKRLVNTFGELFDGESGDARLPELGGPPGSEREVTRRYLAFRALVAPLGTEPVRVALSARRAWQVKLANGLVLELGRDQARHPLEERLERFVAAYPRVVAQLDRPPEYVDLRYPSGFAVRAPEAGAQDGRAPPRSRT
jgi:cell division protein FtsQ